MIPFSCVLSKTNFSLELDIARRLCSTHSGVKASSTYVLSLRNTKFLVEKTLVLRLDLNFSDLVEVIVELVVDLDGGIVAQDAEAGSQSKSLATTTLDLRMKNPVSDRVRHTTS